ncbi:hypothetical protein F5X98DRAFT_391314 [Xylaria grammica]|nr:hypothetical protein F5X98DRAFT_391314 [Xylaria grammica]
MANRPINREKQSTATSDATEPVVSEAVGGKGRKRVCPDDRSDEPRARDLLEQLIQRFDKHEVTVRAEMDSLKTDFIEKMVSTVSHSNIRREEWIHRLQRDVLDLKTKLSVQGGNLHTLRASIDDGLARLRAGTTALQGDVSTLRWNLDDCLPNHINAFPQFRRLPSELRCMVWEWAAKTGRILELHGLSRNESRIREQPKKLEFRGIRSPPVIARVCRESRNIACRHGRLVWIESPRDIGHNRRLDASMQYIRDWAWFDSCSDTLYLNAMICSYPYSRYHALLEQARHLTEQARHLTEQARHLTEQARHLTLKPVRQDNIWALDEMFPSLMSVQFIIGSLEWPVRKDPDFEGSLWSDGNPHAIVRIEDGADGAERAHADLQNRLSPHCGADARASLRRLVTASKREAIDFDDWAEARGISCTSTLERLGRSKLSRVWILSLVS